MKPARLTLSDQLPPVHGAGRHAPYLTTYLTVYLTRKHNKNIEKEKVLRVQWRYKNKLKYNCGSHSVPGKWVKLWGSLIFRLTLTHPPST